MISYRSKRRFREFWTATFRYIILTGLAFVILYPFLIKITIAVMDISNLYDATVRFVPQKLTLDNFKQAAQYMDYGSSFLKTLMFTTGVSLVQVVFSMSAAYGFACFRFPGRRFLYPFVFLILIVPPQAIMFPLYFHFSSLDFFGIVQLLGGEPISLMGSPFSLILLAAVGLGAKQGLLIFIFSQFFKSCPRELEESASIDGAGVLQTFWKIIVPSARPMILTTFLFSFVWQWTDGFYTSIFIPNNTFLARNLQKLVSLASTMTEGAGETASAYALSLVNNAGILLFIWPILLLYFICQRYFVESIERTGLVG